MANPTKKCDGEREIIAPIVHLNGTSKQALIDELATTYDAIGEAMVKLKRCAPNGRDYYVAKNPAEALDKATAQHMRRLKTLQDLQDEIETEINMIDEQG